MAHGVIFFEIYVFGSVRVAYFFTHSREASSLVDHVYDATLALYHPSFQIKVWDIVHNFVTGYGEKGECHSMPHILFKVTHGLISLFKNAHVLFLVSLFWIIFFDF